jgi:hypothetical protein
MTLRMDWLTTITIAPRRVTLQIGTLFSERPIEMPYHGDDDDVGYQAIDAKLDLTVNRVWRTPLGSFFYRAPRITRIARASQWFPHLTETHVILEPSAMRLIASPDLDDDSQPYVSDGIYTEHRSPTVTLLALQASDEGVRILIPCSEVLRYFYGASSSFLTRLLSGSYSDRSVLINSPEIMLDGIRFRHRATGIDDAANIPMAPEDVAYAERQARAIYARLNISPISTGGSAVLRVVPPLRGSAWIGGRGYQFHNGTRQTRLLLSHLWCSRTSLFTGHGFDSALTPKNIDFLRP